MKPERQNRIRHLLYSLIKWHLIDDTHFCLSVKYLKKCDAFHISLTRGSLIAYEALVDFNSEWILSDLTIYAKKIARSAHLLNQSIGILTLP